MGPQIESVSESEDLLSKKLTDLVDGELTFTPQGDGKTVKVSGKVKEIKDPWTGFSSTGDNTGYFVAFKLPSDWVGKKVKISGGNHEKTFDTLTAEDCTLITRLDGYLNKTKKQTFTVDEVETLIVDYSGITQVPNGSSISTKKRIKQTEV